MPTTKKAAKTKKGVQKQKMAEIITLLKTALAKLKSEIGTKKFERKIKKSARILAKGIKPVNKTQSTKTRNTTVKKTSKK